MVFLIQFSYYGKRGQKTIPGSPPGAAIGSWRRPSIDDAGTAGPLQVLPRFCAISVSNGNFANSIKIAHKYVQDIKANRRPTVFPILRDIDIIRDSPRKIVYHFAQKMRLSIPAIVVALTASMFVSACSSEGQACNDDDDCCTDPSNLVCDLGEDGTMICEAEELFRN
ncbi:hypothetical protein BDR07DRAFT_1396164 [Suillus spraguei]|nr:hypothetical protein BDR07DRAFT_1396164 [Suillus spraguei]